MVRAQFLILALLCLHVLLGALCLAASRGRRDSPALRYWGWGLLAYSAGLAFTIMRFLPAPLANFAGNTLISASSILTVHGVLHYTDRRLNLGWAWAGLAAVVAVLAAGNFATAPSMAVNFAVPTVFASILFVYGGMSLLRHPTPDVARPARFVSLVLLSAVLVWWLRLAAMPSLLEQPVDRERLDIVISSFAIAQMLVGVGAAFGLFWVEVWLLRAAMARMAFTDSLTGLPNRRAIVDRFEQEAARWSRTGVGFALAVFDVDRFKDVNDTHGHLAGDALLCHVGQVLDDAKRTEDVLGRLGGEEFVVMLFGQQTGGATIAADRLREAVAATPLAYGGKSLGVTMSGGLALLPEDGSDWDKLFSVADARLYEAKRSGRNRVVGAERPAAEPAVQPIDLPVSG